LNENFVRQVWRFSVAGLANTAFGLTIIFYLIYIGVDALLANLIGYCSGFTFGFIASRKWTFKSKKPIKATAPFFALSALISYLLNFMTVLILQHNTELGSYWVQIGGVAMYAIAMFLLCRILVFKTKDN
jgi:putative flippase GtrA